MSHSKLILMLLVGFLALLSYNVSLVAAKLPHTSIELKRWDGKIH